MKWNKKAIDPDDVRALSSRYGIDLISASIFSRRGVTEAADLLYFLENDLTLLHNPFLFDQMENVVDRILQAKEEGERVKVFGDRDADGITSTVIMTGVLTELGIDVQWALPSGNDPYGLTMDAVDGFAAEDGTLLITVDCGISNHQEIAYAQEKGIDTIVIDHHNPTDELPLAYAIVNPKIAECGYPFRDLAGCGVTSKVAHALYFASTPLFGRPVCLLNIHPGNDSFVLEACILLNLVEVDRVVETVVPGMVDLAETRLSSFLVGREIVVYDAAPQERMLRSLWGPDVEIGLTDIAPEFGTIFPDLKGQSLLSIREKDRRLKVLDPKSSELDVLVEVFARWAYARNPEVFAGYGQYLDLLAVGTLADLMPLRDENRILVREGLDRMRRTERRGLQQLLMRQGISGRRLDTADVAWQISPLINATGRLGVPEKAASLLMSADGSEVERLTDEIVSLNRERKKLGEEVWEKVLPQARESLDSLNGRMVQVGGNSIHRGITGIIATRLMKFFNVPAFVVSIQDGKAVGSARSVKGFNVKEFLDKCSDLFLDYGGHDYAAGYSMDAGDYSRFQERLVGLSSNLDDFEAADQDIAIDAELPKRYMTPGLLKVIELFEPFGESNPPLVFLLREAQIVRMDMIGRKEKAHVKMLIDAGAHKWPAVFWNAADRVGRDFSLHDHVDIAFRLGRNYYQNRENLQLTILDMQR